MSQQPASKKRSSDFVFFAQMYSFFCDDGRRFFKWRVTAQLKNLWED
jgi:hypothetical protein